MIEWMKMLAAGRTPVQGHLLSINVGAVRQVELAGRPRTTAIWKLPVPGRVAVRGMNVVGDEQADRRVHGGPDKAVYAYAREDYAWWERQLGRRLEPGTLGENLTTEGIQVLHRPGHGVTVGLVAASYHRDHRLAVRILAAPELPAAWRQWAEQQTRTRARRTVV